MLRSATVENYLKGIYTAQAALTDSTDLVAMGQLASSLGVVPGTATTMVKALAEAGLARMSACASRRREQSWQRWCSAVIGSSNGFSSTSWG